MPAALAREPDGSSLSGPRTIAAAGELVLRIQDAVTPDATLAEYRAQWMATGHVPVSLSMMGRGLAGIDTETIAFLDETSSTQTVMTRRRGRAPCGHRDLMATTRSHGPNITCLRFLPLHGRGHQRPLRDVAPGVAAPDPYAGHDRRP